MHQPDGGQGAAAFAGACWQTRLSKGMYFLYYCAISFYVPFLPLFLEEAGLSLTTVGMMLGVRPLISMLSAPFWGRSSTLNHKL